MTVELTWASNGRTDVAVTWIPSRSSPIRTRSSTRRHATDHPPGAQSLTCLTFSYGKEPARRWKAAGLDSSPVSRCGFVRSRSGCLAEHTTVPDSSPELDEEVDADYVVKRACWRATHGVREVSNSFGFPTRD